jgi:hypothetical protein
LAVSRTVFDGDRTAFRVYAELRIVVERRVRNHRVAGAGRRGFDAGLEPKHSYILDDQHGAGHEVDSLESGAGAVDLQVTECHHDAGGVDVVDVNAVCAGAENTGLCPYAANRDRLGNRHGAKAAGIQHRNLPAGRGLRDGARKCLARSRATARIRVVSHP